MFRGRVGACDFAHRQVAPSGFLPDACRSRRVGRVSWGLRERLGGLRCRGGRSLVVWPRSAAWGYRPFDFILPASSAENDEARAVAGFCVDAGRCARQGSLTNVLAFPRMPAPYDCIPCSDHG